MSKESPDAEIVVYPDMSEIDDERLKELAEKEREWYGYQPVGEYVVCSDPDCRRVQSIDEVYGVADTKEIYVPLTELEGNGARTPNCPNCGGSSELLIDPDFLVNYLRYCFSQNAYGALLIDTRGEIQGATLAFEGTQRKIFEENINYRCAYDVDKYVRQISSLVEGALDFDSDNIVCWNRLAFSREYRGQGNFSRLVRAALASHPEYDELPAVGDTRFDSNLYPLLRTLGYEDVSTDGQGGVAVFISKFGQLREALSLSLDEFKQIYGAKLRELREAQKKYIIDQDPREKERSYRGMKLLSGFAQESTSPASSASGSMEEGNYRIETYTSNEVTPEIIRELSDAFRYIFCNAFKQYLFYPSEGKPISPQEVFATERYVPLDQLDSLDLETFPRCPQTGERAYFWHHPEVCYQNLWAKLAKDGHISILRDQQTGEFAAFSFGYAATVSEVFQFEEWINPYVYSDFENSEKLRDFDEMLQIINVALRKNGYSPLCHDNTVYIAGAFGRISPQLRDKNILDVTREHYAIVPQEMKEKLLVLLETRFQSKSYHMSITRSGIEIPDVLNEPGVPLEKGDSIILVNLLRDFATTFSLSSAEFRQKVVIGKAERMLRI